MSGFFYFYQVQADLIIGKLEEHYNADNVKGMQRFGIQTNKAFGIKLPVLRQLAKPYKNNHQLALELWETGFHEARLFAIFIDDPKKLTVTQMEDWMHDFNSWDIVDQACSQLFRKHSDAWNKINDWAHLEPEFERRTAFSLLAMLAVHDKKADNNKFILFFPLIEQYAFDNRNFVKKAINWALRQIGKRNENLRLQCIDLCERLLQQPFSSAKWIARDALREFNKPEIIERISNRKSI